jgi:ubiquinone/menaquinone biosynthesis C-methylase UbiE
MNRAKAEFFDSQVEQPWASASFGQDETAKIGRMLRYALLQEGMRVIEPGCGTGRLTEVLADRVGPEGHVLALDISAGMIKAAHLRLGSRPNVSLQRASVESYSFDLESFDAVICHNTFPHFDDKPAVVSHLASALKKGGRFIVFHFMNSDGINDLHRKTHSSVLNDLMPGRPEIESIFKDAGLVVNYHSDDFDGYLLAAVKIVSPSGA